MLKSLTNGLITSFLLFPNRAFLCQPEAFGLRAENAYFQTEDNFTLHGWFFEAPGSKATLLLFHGNTGNISGRLPKAKLWRDKGVSVLLMDYRGYGKSAGKIVTENDLYRDAEAAVKWLKENKRTDEADILLYGESLGSAPAVELAARRKFKGLILEAPFTGLLDLARLHYPWIPVGFIQDFLLDNASKISRVRSPFFLIHGTADETCPYAMGQRLFEKALELKEKLTIPGGAHNDLLEKGGRDYIEKPFDFFSAQENNQGSTSGIVF